MDRSYKHSSVCWALVGGLMLTTLAYSEYSEASSDEISSAGQVRDYILEVGVHANRVRSYYNYETYNPAIDYYVSDKYPVTTSAWGISLALGKQYGDFGLIGRVGYQISPDHDRATTFQGVVGQSWQYFNELQRNETLYLDFTPSWRISEQFQLFGVLGYGWTNYDFEVYRVKQDGTGEIQTRYAYSETLNGVRIGAGLRLTLTENVDLGFEVVHQQDEKSSRNLGVPSVQYEPEINYYGMSLIMDL